MPANVPGDVPSYSNLGIFSLIQLLGGITYTLMSPFYSKEAVQKGMSITETGIIYSCIYFTTFVCTPVFGKYIERIGSRKMFLLGTLVTGMGNLGFGLLQWVEGKHAFFHISLAIRSITSVAEAALCTAVYPLTINAAGEQADNELSQANLIFFY